MLLLRQIWRKFFVGASLDVANRLLGFSPALRKLHHLLIHLDQVPLAIAVGLIRPWLDSKFFLAPGAHPLDLAGLQENRHDLLRIAHRL